VELVDSVVDILNRCGAVDVDQSSAARPDSLRTDAVRTDTRADSGAPIQVVEEELEVGKRAIVRGGVRIYSHLVTEPVEREVRLREEHVDVQRRPVNRKISPEEVSQLRDQTIEVTETAEVPVVAKRSRVREEVVVGKESTERTETVRDNLRRTEVEIEQLGGESESSETMERRMTGSTSGSDRRRDTLTHSPAAGVLSGSGSTAGAGTLAGEATAGTTLADFTPEYRRNFEQTYGTGADFEAMRPAYEYGSTNASEERYRGRSWDEVESNLHSDYEARNPGSSWDKAKAAVRHGWEKVTGEN
jgi:uncharacterized protein (TIGR02271 family)